MYLNGDAGGSINQRPTGVKSIMQGFTNGNDPCKFFFSVLLPKANLFSSSSSLLMLMSHHYKASDCSTVENINGGFLMDEQETLLQARRCTGVFPSPLQISC